MKRGSETRAAAILLTIAMLTLVAMAALEASIVKAEEYPLVYIDPQAYTPSKVGEVFQVRVKIYHVWGISGYEFKIAFNVTHLQCLNVSRGDFFPPAPRSSWTAQADNTEGYVSIQATLAESEALLNGNGFLAFITFNASYGVPYPEKRESSRLHLYDSHLYGAGVPPAEIPHAVQDSNYQTPWQSPTLFLALETSQRHYEFNENIVVSGYLNGNSYPVPNALVALEADTPSGSPMLARTLTTGSEPAFKPVTIVEATSCNFLTGEAKSVFRLNEWAGFKITIKNNYQNTAQHVLVTVNVYDANNSVQALMATEKTIDAAQESTSILCFFIDDTFTVGAAVAYVNVFSGWVKNGGTPLASERAAAFLASDTTFGGQGIETYVKSLDAATLTLGSYETGFKVPYKPMSSGVYKVYAGSRFIDATVFAYAEVLIGLWGDLNHDEAVNLQDLVLLAQAYGSTPADASWNPAADLNGDQKISLPDLVTLARNYGRLLNP